MVNEITLEEHHQIINKLSKHHCWETQRKSSWQRSTQETKQAELINKPVNKLELAIGRRLEEIEWEVRDAVAILLFHGYTTYGSGFKESDGLHYINFLLPGPLNFDMKPILAEIYKNTKIYTWWEGQSEDRFGFTDFNNGNPIYISGISFLDTRGNSQKLREHWNLIAKSLPPSGYDLLATQAEFAQEFRKTHSQ